MRRWSIGLVLLAACSAAETGSAPLAGDDGSPDAAESAPDGGADAPSDLPPVRFEIQIDYRFDTAGFFAAPERKKALEGACRIWGRLLSDSYPNVPKGTFVLMRDPEKPDEAAQPLEIDYEIDDLVLFVGSADLPGNTAGLSSPTGGLSGVQDASLRSALDARYNGTAFQPWTAWVSFDAATPFYFDPEPDAKVARPVPADELDFVSVALHEIGHVLGFGTAPAFKSKVQAGAFTGEKTQASNGGPLSLAADAAHAPKGMMSGGARMLMDTSDVAGERSRLTPLDRAVFEDLGHTF